MRKFKREYTVASDEVQGPGSFVTFRNPTWGEAREGPAGVDGIAARVVAWNWTDENDQPLPLPCDHPEIMDALMAMETAFLIKHANEGMSEERVKN